MLLHRRRPAGADRRGHIRRLTLPTPLWREGGRGRSGDAPDTAVDALSRDLAALMAYGREEDDHAV